MEKQTRSLLKAFVGIALLVATGLIPACKSSELQSKAAEPVPTPSDTAEKVSQTPVDYVGVKATNEAESFDLQLSSRKAKDGSLVELRLKPLVAVKPESLKVVLEGQDFPVFQIEGGEAYLALVAVPFNTKPRETVIEVSWNLKGESKKHETSIPLTVIDGNYRSEVLKVQEEKVNPPKRVIKRILREQKEIGALYKVITPKRYWSGAFQLPINSEMTSPFGNKRVYNGSMKSFHQGLDLRARTPTPIHAPEGARVAMAKDLYFTGNTVILDHGYGLYTIYGHMSKLEVKPNQIVAKGDVLGLSGATGRASGPHLHWGAVLMHLKFNPQDLLQVLR